MKNFIRTSIVTGLFLLSAQASAQSVVEKMIQPIDAFPVSKPIRDVSEQLISVIDTGEITNSTGETAKGPHTVIVELDAASDISVVINGRTIAPGASASFEVDLTALEHRLLLPVYPAVSNQSGQVNYSVSIPNIRVSVCPEGFTETPVDCYRLEYAELTFV